MIYIEKEADKPLYEQIYHSLRQQMVTGELTPGTCLPATRKLAQELRISRNTVDQAYSQLCAEGYLHNRRGSGYYVNAIDFSFAEDQTAEEDWQEPVLWQRQCPYNLEYGAIDLSSFPMSQWRKTLSQVLQEEGGRWLISYGPRDGMEALRRQLARYLRSSRGVQCSPEQIVVGSSTQYLVQLVAQLLRQTRGIQTMAMEEPGFYTVRDVFTLLGYAVAPIPVEEDGISLTALEQSRAQLVYITPSHQFPTGAVLPIGKRLQLLRWAQETGAFVLEDDYDSELRYDAMPIPALQGLRPNQFVIYLGTTSKAFAPTLRLSYMVLPKALLPEYHRLYRNYKSSVPELEQLALARFMEEGHWERHLRRIATQNRRKHDRFVQLLQEALRPQYQVHGSGGGVHVLLEARNGLNEEKMLERAQAAGLGVYPVSPCWQDKSVAQRSLMLGFGALSLEELEHVVEILQACLLCETTE